MKKEDKARVLKTLDDLMILGADFRADKTSISVSQALKMAISAYKVGFKEGVATSTEVIDKQVMVTDEEDKTDKNSI